MIREKIRGEEPEETRAPSRCGLCPRACRADRTRQRGFCGGGARVRVARAALHFGEEPCISGTRGSGAVFFSGCTLRCSYCQNHEISLRNFGREISTERLADIFLELQAQGAHNINLVTAAPYLPWVIGALERARPALRIPVLYNTSGYETEAAVRKLAPYVDIWLADFKYVSSDLSLRLSGAGDYFRAASEAVPLMARITGEPRFGPDGILLRGTLVRHLMLPGELADTRRVIRFLSEAMPRDGFLFSLMRQYTPQPAAAGDPHLSRRVSTYEYRKAADAALEAGLTKGYGQRRDSARPDSVPVFDLTGVSGEPPAVSG